MSRQTYSSQPERGLDSWQWLGVAWDVAMLVLVCLNLALIVFDALFSSAAVAGVVNAVSAPFHDWYAAAVHPDFQLIDLYFVAVFLFDVLACWAVAIWQGTYYRWFFYPFVHWYDVLGCIPLTGFRWLRVLRLVAVLIRLQHLRVLDMRGWRLYAVGHKYYDFLVEELSDRVVLRVLEGVQEEIRSQGGEVQTRVMREVVAPRKEKLVASATERFEAVASRAYRDNRDEIRAYLANLVRAAVRGNATLANLEQLPMLGSTVTHNIETGVRDVIYDVLDELVDGLDSAEFTHMVHRVSDSVFEFLLQEELSDAREVGQALVEVIEAVKEQVRAQGWKQTRE
jgi:hypothetical protein